MLSYTGSAQITGRLVDKESNAALEYATATLYNQDGSINTGVITDKNGKFVLAGLPSGNYFLEMSFMGYESLKIDNIVLENKETFIDLGLLRLSIHTNQLSKVYLETEVPSVLHQIDREIFEASKFQNSVGGSAIDLIKNLPSITVTANGVLRARGSNSFSVLINGKPTQGDASIILSQLPANAVKSVELITAPSAKYDPE
ncbi:MAG: carboxypeptidase regulatory-like domain-containing protein, partial [Wenyingzhuangia sp.]